MTWRALSTRPRHRVPFDSKRRTFIVHGKTWQAISVRPWWKALRDATRLAQQQAAARVKEAGAHIRIMHSSTSQLMLSRFVTEFP